jgi:hypothetical protein
MAEKTLGQAAYEAYHAAVAPTLPKTARQPSWVSLTPQTRAAWEAAATAALEACGGSGCQSPHGPDGRCFDCDDEMAAAIPPPPGRQP